MFPSAGPNKRSENSRKKGLLYVCIWTIDKPLNKNPIIYGKKEYFYPGMLSGNERKRGLAYVPVGHQRTRAIGI